MLNVPQLIAYSFFLLMSFPFQQNSWASGHESRLDSKGRDIRQIALADSLNRLRSAQRELEHRRRSDFFRYSLKLDGSERDCIAYDPRYSACLISLEEFNLCALQAQPPSMDSLDGNLSRKDILKARSRILMSLLNEKYLISQAENGGKRDSLDALVQQAEEKYSAQLRKKIGDVKLRALYRLYQGRLFQSKEELKFEAIATSDSLLADSLWNSLFMQESETAGEVQHRAVTSSKVPTEPTKLPWGKASEEDLPRTVVDRVKKGGLDTLPELARTPYGFLLVRVASLRKTAATSFEKAIPILASLAQADQSKSHYADSAVATFYRHHKEAFLSPDTALFRAWVLPNYKRKIGQFSSDIARLIRHRKPIEDTGRVKSVMILQTDLPPEIREVLELYSPIEMNELLGPIRTQIGTWYLLPTEIRPGGQQLLLSEVQGKIRKILFSNEKHDPVMDAVAHAREKQTGTQMSFISDFLLKKHLPTVRELNEESTKQALDSLMSTMPTELSIPERKKQAVESWSHQEAFTRAEQEKAKWMLGIVLNQVSLIDQE